jgi:hypothetical protein
MAELVAASSFETPAFADASAGDPRLKPEGRLSPFGRGEVRRADYASLIRPTGCIKKGLGPRIRGDDRHGVCGG